jgi:transcriptional regulator GlxA family with amidase domain
MLAPFKVLQFPASQKQSSSPSNPLDSRVSAVLDYLSGQALTTVPSADLIASSLNLSQSRLRSIFKKHAGISFARYVKLVRLHQARSLLQQTTLSVKQVMTHVGLADHSHFARDYKTLFGESPSNTRDFGMQTKLARSFPPRNG